MNGFTIEDAFHLIKQMRIHIDELKQQNATLNESNANLRTINVNFSLINERLRNEKEHFMAEIDRLNALVERLRTLVESIPQDTTSQTALEGEERPSKRLHEDSTQLSNEQSVFLRPSDETLLSPFIGDNERFHDPDEETVSLLDDFCTMDDNGQSLDN